jgi:TorA maturation chaperone TorD
MNQLLARANIYGLCALAFAFMDDDTTQTVRDRGADLAQVMIDAGSNSEATTDGIAFTRDLSEMSTDEIMRGCNELFVGHPQCRLDESVYDDDIFHRHERIANVSGFYKAFGFERAEQSFQRPDFVGAELEFMCLLLLKRAYAVDRGLDEESEVCAKAESKFFNEHLEWWIPEMCDNLQEADVCGFYTSLGSFLRSFIVNETSRYLQPA